MDNKKLIERVKLKLSKKDSNLDKCNHILAACKRKNIVELNSFYWLCSKEYMLDAERKEYRSDTFGEQISKLDLSKHPFWATKYSFEDKPTAVDNAKDLLDFIKKNKIECFGIHYDDSSDKDHTEDKHQEKDNIKPGKDPYDVLDVSKGTSWDSIKRKYKTLMLKHHPDKGGKEEKAKIINEAFRTLEKQHGVRGSSFRILSSVNLRDLWND